MSRSIARGLAAVVEGVIWPLSKRQRAKIRARLIAHLGDNEAVPVKTNRGDMHFFAMVGPHLAGAIAAFEQEEPETREWIDTHLKPGQVLWDIGSCVGLHTIYAGLDPSVRVIAFEPSAPNFSVLTEHIRLNRMEDRIAPLCVALSSARDIAALSIGGVDPGSAGNALSLGAESDAKQLVPVFTGDDLCGLFPSLRPDHIKLDVDSIEGEILRGLRQTLPYVASVLVEVEGSNRDAAAEVIETPLIEAGFIETSLARADSSGRNRLYVNMKLSQ